MATINKSRPDRYKTTGNVNWQDYDGQSIACPKDWKQLYFQYKTAVTTLSSVTFKFDFVSTVTAGDYNVTLSFGFSTTGSDSGSWYWKDVTVLSKYSGEVSVTFSFSPEVTLYPNISLNVYSSSMSTGYFRVTAKQCILNGTQPALSATVSGSMFEIEDIMTVNVTNRAEAVLGVTVCPWNDTDNVLFAWSFSGDSISIRCVESWYANVTSYSTLVFKIIIKDSAGRSWTSDLIALHRRMFTLSVDNETIGIDATNTINISDPYSRLHDITVYLYQYNTTIQKATYQTDTDISGNSFQISIPESAFVQAQQRGQNLSIKVEVTDAASYSHSLGYNRKSVQFYTVTRTGIQVMLNAFTDLTTSPITFYARTGHTFGLQFYYRYDREITVTFTSKGAALKDPSGISNSYIVRDDIATFDCLKRWFDDASDVNNIVIPFTVTVSDEMLRETVNTWEVRAGPDMNPVISVSTNPIQQSNWPSALDPYYVQGYTRVKYEATVTAQTNAAITSVKLTSSQIGTLELLYNNETAKYEVESKAPLIADTDYIITATDQRGLSSSTQSTAISVLQYAFPAITIDSYHRCRDDRTPDDSGSYCEMVVSFAFSALQNLNEKDTALVTTGVRDERTLASYTSQETYFFAADPEHSYQIDISATDLLYTASKTVILSTAGVIMDFLSGGKGIGLGKVAETQRMVEVNPEWRFRSANIDVKVDNSMVDLGTLLAQIQQRLTNGGL